MHSSPKTPKMFHLVPHQIFRTWCHTLKNKDGSDSPPQVTRQQGQKPMTLQDANFSSTTKMTNSIIYEFVFLIKKKCVEIHLLTSNNHFSGNNVSFRGSTSLGDWESQNKPSFVTGILGGGKVIDIMKFWTTKKNDHSWLLMSRIRCGFLFTNDLTWSNDLFF